MSDRDLKYRLNQIRRIYNVDEMLRQDINDQTIVDYYTDSHYGYQIFHSSEGPVHMSLNFDGELHQEGYYEQARIVQEHIDETRPTSVLELASGTGFNSNYLAKQNLNTKFVGIDLTPKHVQISKSKAKGMPNLSFELGDFQDLKFPPESFDLVFVVESLCHASDMEKALSEARRVLKKGGHFIVFDGFRKVAFDRLDSDLQLAIKLVEVSMAVDEFWRIDSWLDVVQENNFSVLNVEDLSEAIIPNLMKFEFLARGYFKVPVLSKAFLKVLPARLVENSIAGLLMPFTVKSGAQGYFVIILSRD